MSGLTREEKSELAQFLDSLPGMPRRVLFTGSRTWEDEDIVFYTLLAIEDIIGDSYYPITLVHGACPPNIDPETGVIRSLDWMASQMAYGRPKFWVEEPHPARWEQFGRGAGPIRNQHMVNLGADACFGFKVEGSRGTADCLARARLADIPTWEVNR